MDLPFSFDFNNLHKSLWRYNAVPYGTFYDKKYRMFLSYFSMGFLKQNVGVLSPFFFNLPKRKPSN
jgi:hypothetical protein